MTKKPKSKEKYGVDPYVAGDLLCDLVEAFPGLWDGETEVNGGDLVEWLTPQIQEAAL